MAALRRFGAAKLVGVVRSATNRVRTAKTYKESVKQRHNQQPVAGAMGVSQVSV